MAYENWSRIIPKHCLFMLSEGEYEEHGPIGLYRAVRDISLPDEVDLVGSSKTPAELAAHLEQCGAVEQIDYNDYHLGAYDKLYPRIFCRHEKQTPKLFDAAGSTLGKMVDVCDICETMFPNTERPATEEEFFEVFSHMRNPATGHRYTDDEYKLAHPEYFSEKAS